MAHTGAQAHRCSATEPHKHVNAQAEENRDARAERVRDT